MPRPRYFTPREVAAHNTPADCWVSYLGKVYDLTPLCKEHAGILSTLKFIIFCKLYRNFSAAGNVLLKPILTNAGRDISHWFDPESKDVSVCGFSLAFNS